MRRAGRTPAKESQGSGAFGLFGSGGHGGDGGENFSLGGGGAGRQGALPGSEDESDANTMAGPAGLTLADVNRQNT